MESSILLDIDVFVKIWGVRLNLLLKKIHYSNVEHDEKYMLGAIIVIPKTIKNKIEQISTNVDRIFFLNSEETVNNILFCSYLLYNRKEKICVIVTYDEKFLEVIVNAIETGFTGDTIVWIFAPIYENAEKYDIFIRCGFDNPHLVTKSPLGKIFDKRMMCMTRKNSIFERYGNIYNFSYVVKNSGDCSMKIRFSRDAIDYLKKLPNVGFEFNNSGVLTQRELSGKFKLKNMGEYFLVDIDEEYIESGSETGVQNMTNRYNFHTHPRHTYSIYNVKYGFPSMQDYLSFFIGVREFGAIFHVVTAIEGIYIISMNSDYIDPLFNNFENTYKFIEKNYGPCRETNDTIEKYIFSINNIKCESKRIFNVVFFDWKNTIGDVEIYYVKSDETCLADDESFNVYKKLYR